MSNQIGYNLYVNIFAENLFTSYIINSLNIADELYSLCGGDDWL